MTGVALKTLFIILLIPNILFANKSLFSLDIKVYKSYDKYKFSLVIKPKNEFNINEDFPVKIFLKGKSIKFNNKKKMKYTRNELKKLNDAKIQILENISIEAKSFEIRIQGSIGLCNDELCHKIDIDKKFKFFKGGVK